MLKNFRCFDRLDLEFNNSMILLSGVNGIGKSSILEALHYACYLRSFRATTPKELVSFEADNFFIKLICSAGMGAQSHEIAVGYAQKKKMVKLDQRPIVTYKDLLSAYRTVTITEDDLVLIQGGPEVRRAFIDQAVILHNPDFIETLRSYKQVLVQRNALIQSKKHTGFAALQDYHLWTERLWNLSHHIARERKNVLEILRATTNRLISDIMQLPVVIDFVYTSKKIDLEQDYQGFCHYNPQLAAQEQMMGRSLFGAHLDDFSSIFAHKASRLYASRGQQKLIVLLLKVAHMELLKAYKGSAVFLLDDFMADFDHGILDKLFDLLQGLDTQLIFTTPSHYGYFEDRLSAQGAQKIVL